MSRTYNESYSSIFDAGYLSNRTAVITKIWTTVITKICEIMDRTNRETSSARANFKCGENRTNLRTMSICRVIVIALVLSLHAAVVFGSDGMNDEEITTATTTDTRQSIDDAPRNSTVSDAAESVASTADDFGVVPFSTFGSEWTYSVYLDDESRVRFYWTPGETEIVMRVEAPTLGSVSVGFARHVHASGSSMAGADLAVGWVQDGKAFLQDRHGLSSGDTKLDKRQDWQLIGGYENATHTSLVVSRRYDTCDRQDVRITNDTMRLIYAFHKDDRDGAVGGASDPGGRTKNHGRPQRGAKSVLLMQRPLTDTLHNHPRIVQWDLRNPKILLPRDEDTLYWCKIFKLPNITRKHHMIGYEPIVGEGNAGYMHHSLVYECRSDGPADEERFQALVAADGHHCYQFNLPTLLANCDQIVAAWTTGSAGFAMPNNVGYAVDPDVTKYYKLEIHFDNHLLKKGIRVSTGLRLFLDPVLREFEAGVLTVGIESNWKHIIPPQQKAVLSYGHCISECTEKAFSSSRGIDIFAVSVQTHVLGRKWRLRHVINETEMAPIATDSNYDYNVQEYRILPDPVKVNPGDHLITECTYISKGRDGITVGGRSTREEMCLAFIYYHPRVSMPSCLSSPTFSSVYGSMGVEEVWSGSLPPTIRRPEAYANHTLAEHVSNYDWEKHIQHFEDVTKFGSFEATCLTHGKSLLPINAVYSFNRNVTELSAKHSNETRTCLRHHHQELPQRTHNHQPTLPSTAKPSHKETAPASRPPRKEAERRPSKSSSANRTTKFESRRTDSSAVTPRGSDVTTIVILVLLSSASIFRDFCSEL